MHGINVLFVFYLCGSCADPAMFVHCYVHPFEKLHGYRGRCLHLPLDIPAAARSQAMDTFFDSVGYETILQWTPDKGEHSKCLGALTGQDVRMRFGMSPLWVACFSCYAGALSDQDMAALIHASPQHILRLLESKTTTISLRSLAEEIQGSQGSQP